MNVCSNILGDSKRVKEGQTESLTLLEDSRRNPDLCQSVQWFQLTVDEAKVHLDLAVCPGASLLQSKMVVVLS